MLSLRTELNVLANDSPNQRCHQNRSVTARRAWWGGVGNYKDCTQPPMAAFSPQVLIMKSQLHLSGELWCRLNAYPAAQEAEAKELLGFQGQLGLHSKALSLEENRTTQGWGSSSVGGEFAQCTQLWD